jgi:hypothetical protein
VEIHVQVLHAPMVHLLFSLVVVVTIVVFKQQNLKITPTRSWLAFLPSIQSMVALVAILAFLFDPMVEIDINVICCCGLRWMLHNTLHGCFLPLENYNICIFFFIKLK